MLSIVLNVLGCLLVFFIYTFQKARNGETLLLLKNRKLSRIVVPWKPGTDFARLFPSRLVPRQSAIPGTNKALQCYRVKVLRSVAGGLALRYRALRSAACGASAEVAALRRRPRPTVGAYSRLARAEREARTPRARRLGWGGSRSGLLLPAGVCRFASIGLKCSSGEHLVLLARWGLCMFLFNLLSLRFKTKWSLDPIKLQLHAASSSCTNFVCLHQFPSSKVKLRRQLTSGTGC